MLNSLRKVQRNEDGQAILLAVVGLLVLSLAVMSTINIGTAIHERVKLQNASDAQAYSIAAMEARAFNFYAFANRTQVSQYVSAMISQSWMSFFNSLLGLITDALALIETLAMTGSCRGSLFWKLCCKALKTVIEAGLDFITGGAWEDIKQVLQEISDLLEQLYGGLATVFDFVDEWVSKAVAWGTFIANYGMYVAEAVMSTAIYATHVLTLDKDVLTANDDKADLNGIIAACLGLVNGGVDVGSFELRGFVNAHDPASRPPTLINISKSPVPTTLLKWKPLDNAAADDADASITTAKRVMTEVANATRYPAFVTDRNPWDWLDAVFKSLPSGLGDFAATAMKFFDMGPMRFRKYGQTKLMTKPEPWYIRNLGKENSQWARGNVMTSDDPYYMAWNPKWLGVPVLPDPPADCTFEELLVKGYCRIGLGIGPIHISKTVDTSFFHWGTNGVAYTDDKNTLTMQNTQHECSKPDRDCGYNGGGGKYLGGHSHNNESQGSLQFPNVQRESKRWASIWSVSPQGGVHCGVGNRYNRGHLAKSFDEGTEDSIKCFWGRKTNWDCWWEDRHPWMDVTPYMKFNPTSQYAQDFGEPTVWTAADKDTTANENKVAAMKGNEVGVTFGSTSGTVHMDNQVAAFFGAKKMIVLSRAKAYYHRPGTWEEHPNFMNPYWGAKLEPIAPGLVNAMTQIPPLKQLNDKFSGKLGKYATDIASNWFIMH